MSRLWVVVFGLAWVTGCEGPAFTSREAVSLGDGGGQDLASETDAGDTPETGSDPRVVVAEAGGDAGVPVDVLVRVHPGHRRVVQVVGSRRV